jgi:hypothetical protein
MYRLLANTCGEATADFTMFMILPGTGMIGLMAFLFSC